MAGTNVALVAGGLDVIGRTLVGHFATPARYESVDSQNPAATDAALARFGHVTHVFHAAYQEHTDPAISTAINEP